jgi:hypothetical protein
MDCIKHRLAGYERPAIVKPPGIVLDEARRGMETADLGGAWFFMPRLGHPLKHVQPQNR